MGLPGGSAVKNLLARQETTSNAGNASFIPGSEGILEKEMTTHSSILAWEIPWIEENGRLQSIGHKRVGHDLATKLPLSNILII